jgi:predicted AAA+ superfamily ATPase
MFKRQLSLETDHSFLLLGARGTGKSTLLQSQPHLQNALWFDLLSPSMEEDFRRDPNLLFARVRARPDIKWVVIDEVQKVPKLLDVVHSLIESDQKLFALSGSSSRKLKAGGANLLAGRAFITNLYPLTSVELGDSFDLNDALAWGTLPKVYRLAPTAKSKFLRSYVQTYIKEEILQEQLVRNMDGFRLFLPIAAQQNGEVINASKIAEQTGIDYKTVQNYFQVLVDTNIGQFLEVFNRSIRKVQIQAPKFYFFDTGVCRAISQTLRNPVIPGTSDFGHAFESFFITECFRLNDYLELDLRLSYLRTKDDAEIDLIVERPDGKLLVIEIKSTDRIEERHLKNLNHFKKDFPDADFICAARVPVAEKRGHISVLPWKEALERLRQ